ncbi:MAG: hypothetical protein RBT59_02225 [Arcobacteraceae bacterium]|jgi:hypothetical protein|nr:hypothetical protein [Arcobacteraceae bacterium]
MNIKNKNNMSLVLSAILVGSIGLVGCGGGGGGGSSSGTTVSGVAVDGYIKQATVTLNGVTTQTNDTGLWSIAYSGNNSDVITIRGGIDTSTNKPFEGTLKAEIDGDGVDIAVTPLSTLVSSLVQNGATKAEASTKIATQLGISEATLTSDPIALLATGTLAQKSEAAQAMKSLLIVQKTAEAFAKAMGNPGSTEYEATFAGVYEVIATKLNSANFATVMGDTSSITTALQTNVALNVTDALLYDRLQAASSSVENIVVSIDSITLTDVQNDTSSVAKAIEQLTTLIENKLVEISSATDIATIGVAKANADVVVVQNSIATLVDDYTTNPDLIIVDSSLIVAVAVANTSPYDANLSFVTFNFTAGTYIYAITNFNNGDVLNFPDGNIATIINESFTDGNVTVQWAENGNVITVNLSNIPIANDPTLFGADSFQTAFGTGSIQ